MAAPPTRPRPALQPLRGAAWLGARATLAARRVRRFARWWLALGGAATVVALLLPVAATDPDVAARAALTRRATDTLRTAGELARALTASQAAESALEEMVAASRGAASPISTRSVSDPRLASLDMALALARGARTPTAYLALAADRAVVYGPRMQALADTLERASRGLEDSPLAASAGRSANVAMVRRLGNTIIAIAQYRRDAIAEDAGITEVDEADGVAATQATAARRTAARAAATLLAAAWRDSVSQARAAHASALEAMRADESADESARRDSRALSPGLLMLLALVGVLGLRFSLALSQEAGAPRLAHAAEAEAAAGAPALAVVRDALPDGPVRFRPSGVDPFRVLYLGLTSTGTRARTLIVTGTDPVIIGAVGARLAIAAAADHRTTLVLDVDPEEIALARIFRAPPEPGFTDARVGAFKWREVARPVGSSDGLAITMISAGTTRDNPEAGDALDATLAEFTKFRDGFEFTIMVAALRDLPMALTAVPASPIVLCGSLGVSSVEAFTCEAAEVASVAQRTHGLVLWDAPRPELPSRAALAAHLSKQKGRTPGGSFQAVRKAVGGASSDTKTPL